MRAAEAEDREENDSQQGKADSEAHAFAEAFGQIDAENYTDDEIHEWDEHQKDPPPWPTDDLAPNVNVIDGDDAGPTGLAGFREHFPHRHDQQQRNEQSENDRDWTWWLAQGEYSTQGEPPSAGSRILGLVVARRLVVAMWKVVTKAGHPRWARNIPHYNN